MDYPKTILIDYPKSGLKFKKKKKPTPKVRFTVKDHAKLFSLQETSLHRKFLVNC